MIDKKKKINNNNINVENNKYSNLNAKLKRYSFIENKRFQVARDSINIEEEWFNIISEWVESKVKGLKENHVLSMRIILSMENEGKMSVKDEEKGEVTVSTESMVFDRGDVEEYKKYIRQRIILLSKEYGVEGSVVKDIWVDYYIIKNLNKVLNNNLKIVDEIVYGLSKNELVIKYLEDNGIEYFNFENSDWNRIMYKLYKNGIRISDFFNKKVCEEGNSYLFIKKGVIEEYRNDILKTKLKVGVVSNYYKAQYLTTLKKLNNNYYKLMVFDIETYVDNNYKYKVYHMGYCVHHRNKGGREYKMFYITDYETEDDLIYDFLKSIMTKKNNKYIIYGHNSIKFDIKLIFEVAIKYYEVIPIMVNKSILGYKIKKDDVEITFKDSYLLMPRSLKDLGLSFNTYTLKSDFPHKLITKGRLYNDTLELPSIDDYYNIEKEVYNNEILTLKEFNIKIQSKKYLKNDLDCLMDCLIEFNSKIFYDYKVNTFQHYTLSGLALKIFRSNYLKKNSIMSLNKALNDELREGYAGGIVDVYIPKGKNLYCYDVNSLYPYVMLEEYAVGSFVKMEFKKPLKFNNDWNGVCWAEVKCNKSIKYPFLTLKKDGILIQPTGEFKGIYTTDEIKYAINLGYEVKVSKVIDFNGKNKPFVDYVNDIYAKKSDNKITNASRFIYKLLLNTLYGVMGASQDKTKVKILHGDSDELAEILATKNVIEIYNINTWVIITYKLDYSLTESEYKGLLEVKNYEENFSNVFIGMSITAKARIHMHKLITYCNNNGINVYYTDTDSIFIDKPLPSSFLGNEIGKLKQEYGLIEEGYFLGLKVYALKIDNNKEIVKFKGISRGGMSFKLIKEAYINKSGFNISQERIYSKKKYNELSRKTLDFNYDTVLYRKREIILDSDGSWVGTKPFNIEPKE